MPMFDQFTVLSDDATLSAGQTVKFDIRAWCFLGAPSISDITDAFGASSLAPTSIVSDTFAPTLKSGATIQGKIKEVITVGQLRGQIETAGNVMNAAKSVPCTEFEIVDNEISLLTAAGTGPEVPQGFGLGLGFIVGAVALIAAYAFYRDLRV